MGIRINPAVPTTSLFDPEQHRTMTPLNYGGLKLRQGKDTSPIVGGRYQLPHEFDSNKFASRYVAKGNEVEAARREQVISGTPLMADGWEVWRYPEFSNEPELDEDGKPKKEKIKNENWVAGSDELKMFVKHIYKPHPEAGKPHEVHSLEANGPTYILMFRPIEVQEGVNEVYGLISLEQMTAEVNGETIAGEDNQDTGMLGDRRLVKTHVDSDIESERKADNIGRSAVVKTSLPNQPTTLRQLIQKVSRTT